MWQIITGANALPAGGGTRVLPNTFTCVKSIRSLPETGLVCSFNCIFFLILSSPCAHRKILGRILLGPLHMIPSQFCYLRTLTPKNGGCLAVMVALISTHTLSAPSIDHHTPSPWHSEIRASALHHSSLHHARHASDSPVPRAMPFKGVQELPQEMLYEHGVRCKERAWVQVLALPFNF